LGLLVPFRLIVRFGSIASFEASSSDVRYYPERRHPLPLQYLSQRAKRRSFPWGRNLVQCSSHAKARPARPLFNAGIAAARRANFVGTLGTGTAADNALPTITAVDPC
jgi:hypothetical protein